MNQQSEPSHTRILYIDWNCYGGQDMKKALQDSGAILSFFRFSPRTGRNDSLFEKDLGESIRSFSPEYVFSFNYFPIISKVCNTLEVIYVSWVYDNPLVALYSYTLANPWNRVFLFDKMEYQFFRDNGIPTVHYLPLAAAPDRLRHNPLSPDATQKYQSDISFVGSLYTEPKQRLYDHLRGLPEFTRGYLDAVMHVQMQLYGISILEDLLNDDILSDLRKACPCPPNRDGVETERYLYSNYFLFRQVTAMERREAIQRISSQYPLHLYTNDITWNCPGCINHGSVDYYLEAPHVFRHSRINLNITLRSIKSGIPLRAYDIMGSQGFLLTNYQEDFLDYFVPDEDFVYYTNMDDMMNRIEYYLSHEKERQEICQNGYYKILLDHTYEKRIPILFSKT